MKIASWNVEGRLTHATKKKRGTPQKILNMIEQIHADVVVLPEAYIGKPAAGVNEKLAALGYTWQDARYNEHDSEHPDDNYIRVLSKLKIKRSEQFRWNNVRGLLSVILEEPVSKKEMRIIATHLDERSDTRRLAQLKDAVSFVNSSNLPTVMLGDFNAMHDDARAKFIRSQIARTLVSLLPSKRIQSPAHMLMEMASGASLAFLESNTNLRDVDVKHRPTTTPKLREIEWMPSVRTAQIDHIFVTPDITATKFKISKDGGSDHRAISADIEIK